jgi:hypothetical protein
MARFRAFSYDATQAIIVDEIYTEIFKKAVSRTRPDGSDKVSFPSGHASTAFALATVAQRHYGWKVGVPSYLAASAIGLSRIEYNRHYFSDVLAGATLGIITGRTVVRTNGESGGPASEPLLRPHDRRPGHRRRHGSVGLLVAPPGSLSASGSRLACRFAERARLRSSGRP